MNIIDIIKLLRKHIVLLVVIPVGMVIAMIYLTRNPTYTFSSETTLYTGLASGTSIEMDKSFSFFATNTAFDNFINIIKSRNTHQEVAVRLLAQHLMLGKADPVYIKKSSFDHLRRITPDYVKKLVVKSNPESLKESDTGFNRDDSLQVSVGLTEQTDSEKDSAILVQNFKFKNEELSNTSKMQPPSINRKDYEETVENFMKLMNSSDTNFIYEIINFNNPHYSVKAISSANVQRIASSDLVKVKYDSDDPGICQQTLVLLIEVCMKNFRNIKENRSDAVVKYFEHQVKLASIKLKMAEEKLLQFNKENNIINYYEQSKAVAVVKEELEVNFYNKKMKLAGHEAAIKRIEEKLNIQQKVQLNSSNILDFRNKLGIINAQITNLKTTSLFDTIDYKLLSKLEVESADLKEKMRAGVESLYLFKNSIEGIPMSGLLNDWISNVIELEDTKAALVVMKERINEFQKQYAVYAPAGANLKKIEREISVSEREYLELLHGLNLAKLKVQDVELSSNIKAVDPPYYPLSPNPTKRKVFIIVSGLVGFIIVLASILALEYFDNTLKNTYRASKKLGLKPAGIFPKVYLKSNGMNIPFIINRLVEQIIQQTELSLIRVKKPSIILINSILSNEGKSVILYNLSKKLINSGNRVLALNFSRESLQTAEVSQLGYETDPQAISKSGDIRIKRRFSIVGWVLGYPDSRVDYESGFLADPAGKLAQDEYLIYNIDQSYKQMNSVTEFVANKGIDTSALDYILIEIPPILYYSYPKNLPPAADVTLLICRANRVWTDADKLALDTYRNFISNEASPLYILNGVESGALEDSLGELPKNRTLFSRIIKKFLQFQFFNRNQI